MFSDVLLSLLLECEGQGFALSLPIDPASNTGLSLLKVSLFQTMLASVFQHTSLCSLEKPSFHGLALDPGYE